MTPHQLSALGRTRLTDRTSVRRMRISPKPSHVRRWLACAAVVSAVVLIGSASASAVPFPPAEAAPQFLWVAYKYPALSNPRNEWDSAIKTGAGQSFVINVANGPGKLANSDYRQVVARARAAGIGLTGYVFTSYGARDLADVKANIDGWRSLYGITSIFLDEAASATSATNNDRKLISYYAELHRYIHARGGAVVLNPGVVPDQEYFNVADSIVTFEGSAASYRGARFPRWTADEPDRKITHIVYGARAAEAPALIDRAHALGAGFISVTDDTLPNPYDSLPSYYLDERKQIRNLG